MSETRRELAAIMFTDIVGYTKLMAEDEEKALQTLQKNRSLHQSIIHKHQGKWLKEMGDGTLAKFNSTNRAIYCACQIITLTAREGIPLRIGIHQGDVVLQDGDIFGGGVNIASRIESITPTGRIWISESVQRNLLNKKEFNIEFIKEALLKNVQEKVRIYDVHINEAYQTQIPSFDLNEEINEKSQEDKSIAILPFINMSNDPEQDYFCDGLSEELLNVLAQLDKIKVAARTSSFMFKGQNLSIKEIGKKIKSKYRSGR